MRGSRTGDCGIEFRPVSLFLAVSACLLALCVATVAIAVVDTPTDEILTVLKVDDVPADYVILVDTSKSMNKDNRYVETLSAVRKFTSALSPNDHVTLISFDSVPRLEYSGKVGENPSRIASELPQSPPGNYTDIGSVLQYAIAELKRPDVSDFASVILLTDGEHDPPRGSAYPAVSGSAWTNLRNQAAGIDGVDVSPYAMGLAQGADAALMKTVFPDAAVVDLPASQLAGYFNRVKEQSRRKIARSLLEAEKDGAVRIVWKSPSASPELTAESSEATVIVTSDYKIVPVSVESLTISASGDLDPDITGLPTEAILLEPGQTKEIPVVITWHAPTLTGFGERQVDRVASLAATAAVGSPWAKAMADDLGVKFVPTITADALSLTASGVFGTSWLLVGGITAAVLLLIVLIILLFRPPPKPTLKGSLFVDGVQRSLSESSGGAVLRIGGSEGMDPRVSLTGVEGDAMVVEARRDGRKGAVFTYATEVNQRVDIRTQDGRWERFGGGRIPMGTELRIGEHEVRF